MLASPDLLPACLLGCPIAECIITPAPADSLAAGASTSASTSLRRKACKDVTSGEGDSTGSCTL
jgi:hypothetical protein